MTRGKIDKYDIEREAEKHAEWTAKFLKFVYKEAFIHGYKHGVENAITFTKRNESVLHCRFCHCNFKETDLYETSPNKGIVCAFCRVHLESYIKSKQGEKN